MLGGLDARMPGSLHRTNHENPELIHPVHCTTLLQQEDVYFKELVRYIHLNPLRANIVSDLKSLSAYPYSGHSALMGKINRTWQSTDYVLGLFGKDIESGSHFYQKSIKKGIAEERRADLVGGGLVRSVGGWTALKSLRRSGFRQKADERILGDGDFVSGVLHQLCASDTRA